MWLEFLRTVQNAGLASTEGNCKVGGEYVEHGQEQPLHTLLSFIKPITNFCRRHAHRSRKQHFAAMRRKPMSYQMQKTTPINQRPAHVRGKARGGGWRCIYCPEKAFQRPLSPRTLAASINFSRSLEHPWLLAILSSFRWTSFHTFATNNSRSKFQHPHDPHPLAIARMGRRS